MTPIAPLRCPVGCDVELEPMGRWAPYRTCSVCGTGFWRPAKQPAYWGQRVEPSAEQQASWAGRDEQREATVGPGPGRLLDVGCGFGHFINWARDHGWDAWGCDSDPWALERSVAPDRTVSRPEDAGPPFDMITLWDVLEHIGEPVEFLSRLRPLLRPRARLVAGSPNFAAMKLRWPVLRHFPERFNTLIRPEEHTIQFTERGIQLALEHAGFERIEFLHPPLATRTNPMLDLAVRLVPQLRKGLFVRAHAPG